MTTKCFKLISGEEIITDIITETDEFVGIKNPMFLAIIDEGKLAMYPWLPLAENKEHTLARCNVLIEYTPNTRLVDGYKQRTGGIVTAPPGLLNQLGR